MEEETAAPGAGHGSVRPCLVSLMLGGSSTSFLDLLWLGRMGRCPVPSHTVPHHPAPPSMDGAASPLRGAGTSRGAGCRGGLSVPGVLAGKSSLLPAWEVLPCVLCLAWGVQGSPVPAVPGEAWFCRAVGTSLCLPPRLEQHHSLSSALGGLLGGAVPLASSFPPVLVPGAVCRISQFSCLFPSPTVLFFWPGGDASSQGWRGGGGGCWLPC